MSWLEKYLSDFKGTGKLYHGHRKSLLFYLLFTISFSLLLLLFFFLLLIHISSLLIFSFSLLLFFFSLCSSFSFSPFLLLSPSTPHSCCYYPRQIFPREQLQLDLRNGQRRRHPVRRYDSTYLKDTNIICSKLSALFGISFFDIHAPI